MALLWPGQQGQGLDRGAAWAASCTAQQGLLVWNPPSLADWHPPEVCRAL